MEVDKALVILEKTNDGDDLTPTHLKLLELAVNGQLNERGLAEFDKLYQSVADGKYARPAYLGVEFMDRDHEGYVYFKGQQVEHYSSFWAYSLDAKASLKRLQQECLFLEAKGLPVNQFMQCDWKLGGKYAEEFCLSQKSKLDTLAGDRTLLFSVVKTEDDSFMLSGHPPGHIISESARFRDISTFRSIPPQNFSLTHYAYAPFRSWREATEEEIDSIDCCFDYLLDKEYLQEMPEATYQVRENQSEDYEDMDLTSGDEEDEFEQ